MRVFLTGASGFVGSAIIPELLGAGHQVLGLARSDASAKAVAALGAEVHRGDLNDLDTLKSGAEATDGVIHCGFVHDFANFEASCETDRNAINTIGAVLEGTGRPFIVTSGTGILAPGRFSTEEDAASLDHPSPRVPAEGLALALASRGVRAMLVRLPPTVHGDGDQGFIPILINIARQKGLAAYLGDGQNRWPAVHRPDAARLYRLALENGQAGARYHAVGEEGIPTRQIAEVMGRRLGLPVVSKSPEEAAEHFGWFGYYFGIDIASSSALTQQRLGWRPTGTALIDDLERGTYFDAA